MKIFIVPNYSKKEALDCADEVIFKLKKFGHEVFTPIEITSNNRLSAEDKILLSRCDMVITIGGDGTTLRTAKDAAVYGLPVLSINAGRLGFMCGLEKGELDSLKNLKTGNFIKENRMMLRACLYDGCGNLIYECNALNDAVVSRGSRSRILDLDVTIENSTSIHLRADGVIISTPTGSTAYALSAGGPVIDPTIECIQLMPVCSHDLFSRPVIFSSETELKINGDDSGYNKCFLTVDGEDAMEIPHGGYVSIKKSDICTRLIRMCNDSFYDVLKNKFKD